MSGNSPIGQDEGIEGVSGSNVQGPPQEWTRQAIPIFKKLVDDIVSGKYEVGTVLELGFFNIEIIRNHPSEVRLRYTDQDGSVITEELKQKTA